MGIIDIIKEKVEKIKDAAYIVKEILKLVFKEDKSLIIKVTPIAISVANKSKNMSVMTENSDKIDKGIEIASDILQFRKDNPEDFEKVLNLAGEFVSKYNTDPKIKEKILSLFKT